MPTIGPEISFASATAARVSAVPVVSGQLVAVENEPGFYYDYGNTRYQINDKTFVIGSQTLEFTNLVATVSNSRVTASTFCNVYFTDSTLTAATAAGITVDTSSGTITFTATTAPTASLVCDIVCRNP